MIASPVHRVQDRPGIIAFQVVPAGVNQPLTSFSRSAMLGTLRKGAHSFVAKALMGLLVLSFGAWGIGDILRGGSDSASVAAVGDDSISKAEFLAEMEKLKRSFGGNFSPELLKSLNLHSLKLSELINRRLIKQEVKRLGIAVSDEDLLVEVSRDPEFHNANGAFDKPLFKKTLQRNRINEKQYLESVRTELEVRILLKTLALYSLAPPELLDALYTRQHEQRRIALFAVTAPATAIAAPDQEGEALHRFHEEHKAGYVAPEYRSIGYAEIRPEDILGTVEVSRQEIFDAYTQRSSEFTLPEQRDVEQLLYENKAGAEIAYGMLRAGKSKEEVIKAAPPAEGKSVALGFKTKEAMPVGKEAIFALDKGEFTAPVPSPFGWHIFIVQDIKPESAAPFDSVKEEVRNEIVTRRANARLAELLEKFEDAISAGNSPKEAAEAVGLKYKTTDPLDRQGRRSDQSVALDDEKEDALLATAFSLGQGERSKLIGRPDGGYYMVQVDSITPPRARTFDEVRGQVSEDYMAFETGRAVADTAKRVTAALRRMPPGSGAASDPELKGAAQHSVTVNRGGAADKTAFSGLEAALTPALLDQVFSLTREGDVTDPIPYPGGYAIGVLKEKIPAPSATASAEGRKLYKALKRTLREDYRNELLEEYLRYLRTRYPVTVNDALLRSLMTQ